MIEIKFRDLQPNQTYYIDMSNALSTNMAIEIIKKKYGYTRKLKAIFKKIVPESHVPAYAMFYEYTDVNSSKVNYIIGPCNFMNYRSYKYYLPTRDALLQKREKDTVNAVLQHITGDPSFKYYL